MLTPLREMAARTRAVFSTRDLDRDFDEELESHVEMLAQDNIRQGMTPEQGRRAAKIRLGGLESTRQRHRDARGLPAVESVLQDLRYAFRTLRRDSSFTLFAILIVGCGIGAASTIFSVVNAVLLRPLPFKDPDQLVWIENSLGKDMSDRTVQVGHFLELKEHAGSFSDLAAYYAFYGVGDTKLTGDGKPERLNAVPVSDHFFSVLGVQPQLGRSFTADEGSFSSPRSVILSDHLWKKRFASDPEIVGRAITLNEKRVTVVGVLPASFDFATVLAPGSSVDLYLPFPLTEETNRRGNTIAIIGRLKRGIFVQGAQAECKVLGALSESQHHDWNKFRPRLTSLEEHVSGRVRPALIVLVCAVGLVMLIVCANLSNLLLARTATRRKEMAVRAALGAWRSRLIRQLLTESILLCGCGAALGLVLAVIATHVLSRLNVFSIPLLGSVRVDLGGLGFTLLAAVITGLLFGLAPALQVPAFAVHASLQDSSRGSTGSRGFTWIRSALVISEVALACVLVVCASLLFRSFLSVLNVDPGFQPAKAAAIRVDPSSRYSTPAQRNAYFDEILRRVASIPGVEGVGLTDVLPLSGNRIWAVKGLGQAYPKGETPSAFLRVVSRGYLRALGIPLRAGRDLTEQDAAASEPVILINETLARTLWPGQNPIGQVVKIGRMLKTDPGWRVVGVVGDVRHLALERGSGGEMYLPIRQIDDYSAVDLVIRTALPPAGLAGAVRAALVPIEPDLPAGEFRTLQEVVDQAVSPRRFIVILLAGFSVFALALASLGIYAVISYSVKQRTKEFGIRMALGASARELKGRVLLQTLGLTGVGLLIGLVASWLLGHALNGFLFGVTATDPATFLGMVVVLTSVATIAGYLPARRAAQIDPMVAIRTD